MAGAGRIDIAVIGGDTVEESSVPELREILRRRGVGRGRKTHDRGIIRRALRFRSRIVGQIKVTVGIGDVRGALVARATKEGLADKLWGCRVMKQEVAGDKVADRDVG